MDQHTINNNQLIRNLFRNNTLNIFNNSNDSELIHDGIIVSSIVNNLIESINDNEFNQFSRVPNINFQLYFPTSSLINTMLNEINNNTNNTNNILSDNEFNECIVKCPVELFECPICYTEYTLLDPLANVVKLKNCEHQFCYSCIKKWLTISNNSCPICRLPVLCKDDTLEEDDTLDEYGTLEGADENHYYL